MFLNLYTGGAEKFLGGPRRELSMLGILNSFKFKDYIEIYSLQRVYSLYTGCKMLIAKNND